MNWSAIDVALACREEGWGSKNGPIAVAVCRAESGFNDQALYTNTDKWKSRDRGLFQINDHWHPEVSDDVAFNGRKNIHAARKIYEHNGHSFKPWSAYTGGTYTRHLEVGRAAWDAAGRLNTLTDTNEALTEALSASQDALQKKDLAISGLQAQLGEAQSLVANLSLFQSRFDSWVASIKG